VGEYAFKEKMVGSRTICSSQNNDSLRCNVFLSGFVDQDEVLPKTTFYKPKRSKDGVEGYLRHEVGKHFASLCKPFDRTGTGREIPEKDRVLR
jgi:hypothetical protein